MTQQKVIELESRNVCAMDDMDLGLTAGDSFCSHPISLLAHLLPTISHFFSPQVRSFAHPLAWSERKRLLRRLTNKRIKPKQMDRQTDRKTSTQTDRKNRHRDNRTDIEKDRMSRQTDRQTDRQTNRQTDRKTDRQTNRQTDRQTNRLAVIKNRRTKQPVFNLMNELTCEVIIIIIIIIVIIIIIIIIIMDRG